MGAQIWQLYFRDTEVVAYGICHRPYSSMVSRLKVDKLDQKLPGPVVASDAVQAWVALVTGYLTDEYS